MSERIVFPEFELENGRRLLQVPVAYRTWGRLNAAADNAVVVCHALTGDAAADDWWGALIGPGKALDTDVFFIVCANVIGSPYGTVSPVTDNPETGKIYGVDFPSVTIRDTVRLHRLLMDALGVRSVAFVIGGSMGGMHVLEWGFFGDFVRALVPMAVGGRHSAWCIGWSEAQRQAIYADPRWNGGDYTPDDPPAAGLAAARMAAMISYRTRQSFEARFGRDRMPGDEQSSPYAVESYLAYQGRKLVQRFDANCYVSLTRQMDSHDVGTGRPSYEEALAALKQPTLVFTIDTDILYPRPEQEELVRLMPNAELVTIESEFGHDAFLIEFDQIERLLISWIDSNIQTDIFTASRVA
jgi:homoserine O-acetyltransferase/O-succinyltransferase